MGPNPQESADLVIFTEEIFNGKRHFFVQRVSYIRLLNAFQPSFIVCTMLYNVNAFPSRGKILCVTIFLSFFEIQNFTSGWSCMCDGALSLYNLALFHIFCDSEMKLLLSEPSNNFLNKDFLLMLLYVWSRKQNYNFFLLMKST